LDAGSYLRDMLSRRQVEHPVGWRAMKQLILHQLDVGVHILSARPRFQHISKGRPDGTTLDDLASFVLPQNVIPIIHQPTAPELTGRETCE
jgi:hypothetical protein